jgi:heme o synthase
MSLANDEADLSQAARVASIAPGVARAGDYLALTKPRVMSLVVFTAAVGLLVAPGHLDPVVGLPHSCASRSELAPRAR